MSGRQLHNAVGVAASAIWIFLFAGGTIVATSPYMNSVNNPELSAKFIKSCFMVICFYTLSNVSLLCVCASMLGGICREGDVKLVNLCILGLFVYMAIVSGLLLIGQQPFANMNQENYIRFAGICSMTSFTLGYDPKKLSRFFDKIERTTSKNE